MDEQRIVDPQQHAAIEGAIQPGAVVLGSDGGEVGSVVSVTAQTMTVKKKGIFGGQVEIPKSLVREVEEGHIELDVPAKDAARR
jgi:hypothetical protein